MLRLFGRLISNIEAMKESIFFGFTNLEDDAQINFIRDNILMLFDNLES